MTQCTDAAELLNPLELGAAGAFAGMLSRTCTAPLDRLKTLMALRDAFYRTQKVKLSSRRGGVLGGIKLVVQQEGITALWRGNFVNVIKVMPESAVKYTIFEKLKREWPEHPSLFERFSTGAAAGMIAQAAVYPLDVIKTRIAASERGVYRHELRYGGMVGHVVRRMYKYEGVSVLYKGMGVSLVGMIPYAGVDLAAFDYLKSKYCRENNVSTPPVPVALCCGMVSSCTALTITYPLGLVRTRLQAQGMTPDRPRMYRGPTHCFMKTLREGGLRGLYSGFTPSLLKVIPASAISFTVFERVKFYFSLCKDVEDALLLEIAEA
eukprot:Sspe_Gene.9934::Locus_3338_Transcript_3_3_Confidence_0.600_Length_1321::g.9934::m.9934/K14684/SLC25A23S; solute carrier family 25 (mitochondrial phosphate transporter), member 23/24/25/41